MLIEIFQILRVPLLCRWLSPVPVLPFQFVFVVFRLFLLLFITSFHFQLLRGLNGEKIVECAYVKSDVTDATYFSTPLVLGVR